MRDSSFVLMLSIIFALVAGTWLGAIGIMVNTYQQCSTKGTVTFNNFILAETLILQCQPVKE